MYKIIIIIIAFSDHSQPSVKMQAYAITLTGMQDDASTPGCSVLTNPI